MTHERCGATTGMFGCYVVNIVYIRIDNNNNNKIETAISLPKRNGSLTVVNIEKLHTRVVRLLLFFFLWNIWYGVVYLVFFLLFQFLDTGFDDGRGL